MASPADRLRARFEKRAKQLTPDLGEEILKAWDNLSGQINTARLADAIASGGALGVAGSEITDEVLDAVFADVEQLYFEQTVQNVAFWAKDFAGEGIAFNVLNPEVIEGIRNLNLKMADELKDDVRNVVEAVVENGLRDGVGPRTIARGIKKSVSLTETQFGAVRTFREELEANSRKALNRQLARNMVRKPDGSLQYVPGHAGGTGVSKRDLKSMNAVLGTDDALSTKQIDRIVASYQRRLTAWHAETVARTATVDSLKAAQNLSTEQAIRQGILPRDLMRSEWVTSGDNRVREEHVAMNGQIVNFGEPFSNGQVIPGTGDYGCRCLKRDFLGRDETVDFSNVLGRE